MFKNINAKIIFTIALLTTSCQILCMEKINKWEDVKKFAGKSVAYKTTSDYLSFSDNYKLVPESKIKYDILDSLPFRPDNYREIGFNSRRIDMRRIIMPKSVCGVHALTDSTLKGANLFMRLLTDNEKTLLKKAISCDLAKVEYRSKEYAMSYFDGVSIWQRLRPYLWPAAKVTLYTSCSILGVVLASKLFNWPTDLIPTLDGF